MKLFDQIALPVSDFKNKCQDEYSRHLSVAVSKYDRRKFYRRNIDEISKNLHTKRIKHR